MIRSNKVLRSAKGQTCAARFPGICNGNAETVVFCHLNGAAFGKGMGIKAHDILGFYGCSACHSYYDNGHGTHALLSTDTLLECVLGAVCETWVRLVKAEIVAVPDDTPKPRKTKPRPPKSERAKIQSGRKLQSRNDLRKPERTA